jgi:ERI1 exoribonuclease 3
MLPLILGGGGTTENGEETGEERQAAFSFLFVTCGNWDIKTQIPRQCAISKFDMPGYFHEWVNLKDVYLNFYKHKALGMRSMLAGLGLQLEGEHHSGKDDVQNICKIISRMVHDGVLVEPTAKRAVETGYVTYKYQHRV